MKKTNKSHKNSFIEIQIERLAEYLYANQIIYFAQTEKERCKAFSEWMVYRVHNCLLDPALDDLLSKAKIPNKK